MSIIPVLLSIVGQSDAVFDNFGFCYTGFSIVTSNALIQKDFEILGEVTINRLIHMLLLIY
ncbi:hypothetical protein Ferp_0418 [Ferroglobus placidus DSM 10642]|uniref:Uncharacterized protein n=1 Tax=Ferroglobus placidus (strain DSM 10642 / AEDII12DO) TaxID=589924 RepID=D3S2W2_FERPA|nr:hypothetical protein Ferp_0418 [Ferroglobus placidus DSM 10642]